MEGGSGMKSRLEALGGKNGNRLRKSLRVGPQPYQRDFLEKLSISILRLPEARRKRKVCLYRNHSVSIGSNLEPLSARTVSTPLMFLGTRVMPWARVSSKIYLERSQRLEYLREPCFLRQARQATVLSASLRLTLHFPLRIWRKCWLFWVPSSLCAALTEKDSSLLTLCGVTEHPPMTNPKSPSSEWWTGNWSELGWFVLGSLRIPMGEVNPSKSHPGESPSTSEEGRSWSSPFYKWASGRVFPAGESLLRNFGNL